jgi:hypothetical protein
MMRKPYSTECRFLKDEDGITATVKWVEARPGAKPIPFPSAICSLDWEPQGTGFQGVGEVYGSPRGFKAAKAPVGVDGSRFCGTSEDFNSGGTYEPDLPPTRYGAAGFPLCCNPAPLPRGGAGASGRSLFQVVTVVEPGSTCATALRIAMDTEYTFLCPPLSDQWVNFETALSATESRVEFLSGNGAAFECLNVLFSCGYPFPTVPDPPGANCRTMEARSALPAWLRFRNTTPSEVAYTIRLRNGGCP